MDSFGFDKDRDLPASQCVIPAPFLLEESGRVPVMPNLHVRSGTAEWSTATYLVNTLSTVFSAISFSGHGSDIMATALLLNIDPGLNIGSEGYHLDIDNQTISLRGQDAAGLFYAAQTLLQLFPPSVRAGRNLEAYPLTLPRVHIEDRPRFPWRGAMLDVARHFMPVEFVRLFIDLLAMHKMNILHLHLTDDQGWRIEVRRYPRLTQVGAFRRETLAGHLDDSRNAPVFDNKPHGGYYSQVQIHELVAYAARRHVTIVPEIELPGHAQAAIAAYPDLGVTGEQLEVCTTWGIIENVFNPNESTIEFLQNVLGEMVDLFPSPFIHVGGDEVVKTQWKQSEMVQCRILELGLQSEEELQAYIVGRMNECLNLRGRRLIGWEEILGETLPIDAAVMSWRGEQAGARAASLGHDVVMAPVGSTYLDLYQSQSRSTEPVAQEGYLPLHAVYQFDPVPDGLASDAERHILGAQAQIWTEYISTPAQVEYMAFPRLTALAEVVWSDWKCRDYGDFMNRLAVHVKRLQAQRVNYYGAPSK